MATSIGEIEATLRLRDEMTQKLGQIQGQLKGVVGGIGEAILKANLIERGVSSLIGFGKQAFAMASQIDDASKKLGISAEATQRFKFAAEQTGASLSSVERALGMMNRQLAGGSTSTVAALKTAGLEFESIRTMRPEDAFLAISEAVGRIEDPMTRAHVAQQLFGRGALDLLPAMIEGMKDLGAQTDVMSNDTVARLAAAEDAWKAFSDQVTIVSGELVGTIMRDVSAAASGWGKLWGDIKATATGGLQGHRDYIASLQDQAAAEASAQSAAEARNAATRNGTQGTKDQEAADRAAAAAAKAHADEIRGLADQFSGAALQDQVRDIHDAYKLLTPAQKENEGTQKRLAVEVAKLVKEGAQLPPVLADIARDAAAADLRARELEGSFALLTSGLETWRRTSENSIASADYWRVVNSGLLDTETGIKRVDAEMLMAERDAGVLERAFKTLGLNSTASLQQYARDAEQAYLDIKNSGVASAEDIEFAYDLMVQAQREASGVCIELWRDASGEIFRIFDKLGLDVTGVWNGVLTQFTNGFLGGLTKAVGNWAPGFLSLLGNLGSMTGKRFVDSFVNMVFGFDLTGMISRWTGGPSPERLEREIGVIQNPDGSLTPVMGTGIEQPEYERRYGDGSDPRGPEFDEGQNTPNFASGGYVPAKAGGTLARIGEGGEGEYIIPESKAGGVTVNMYISTLDVDSFRKIRETLTREVRLAMETNLAGERTRMIQALGGAV